MACVGRDQMFVGRGMCVGRDLIGMRADGCTHMLIACIRLAPNPPWCGLLLLLLLLLFLLLLLLLLVFGEGATRRLLVLLLFELLFLLFAEGVARRLFGDVGVARRLFTGINFFHLVAARWLLREVAVSWVRCTLLIWTLLMGMLTLLIAMLACWPVAMFAC